VAVNGLFACAYTASSGENNDRYSMPSIKHHGRAAGIEQMIEAMTSARAVVMGESHDRYDHHLNQLEIIKRLHERRPGLAIGMEQFQQPFQPHLDDYVKGVIDTEAMLIKTEYYERWKFDFRHYEPILSYARQQDIPVIALNLPAELTRKAAAEGLAGLDDDERARIPQLDRSDDAYRERLREVFSEHPMSGHGGSFENFYTAQLLWDEGMAARAAEYLRDNPHDLMVVLAGGGHVEFGSGIPERLARRIDGEVVSVVHADDRDNQAARADYVLSSTPIELPERGMLGVMIDPQADAARVHELADDSAAGAAGVRTGDVILALDGRAVNSLAALRARLWDKTPGDRVSITVRRGPGQPVHFDIVLR